MRRTKPPSALEWQSFALPRHPTGAPELPYLHSHRLLSCPLWQAHPAPCKLIGIVSCSGSRALYERFYDGFASHGEPNIPFDKAFLRSEPFYTLLARLKQHVEEHQRDHWCPPQTLNLVAVCIQCIQRIICPGQSNRAFVVAPQLLLRSQELPMCAVYTQTLGMERQRLGARHELA